MCPDREITRASTSPQSAAQRFDRFRRRIAEKVLVFDGGMGSGLQEQNLPESAFGGYPDCNEILNVTCPDAVRKIHQSYFAVGCDVVETNSFQGHRLKLSEYDLGDRTEEINRAAASIAREIAESFETADHPRFVAGSIGPLSALPSSGDPSMDTIPLEEIEEIFHEQALGLVLGNGTRENPNGVDVLIVETGQDPLQFRQAVFAIERLRKDLGLNIPLIVQFTFDQSGRTLFGSDAKAILAAYQDLPIDVIGLNCSTGPEDMRSTVRYLGEHAPMWVSVMPNAGLPCEKDGHVHWPLTPETLASELKEFVGRFKVSIVGGCCGTTPAHIEAVIKAIGNWKPSPRPTESPRIVSSPLATVEIDEFPRPIIIGERLNAQGSKKAKKAVIADDLDALFALAQKQVNNGASILDIALATNERSDEAELMERVVTRLSAGIQAPLMIDTTDPEVVEHALRRIPGRAIINSINFEGGEERARKTLELARRHGSLVVCLLIDEQGMALEVKHKRAIAMRIANLARCEFDICPDRLIFDPLTFTLGTGEEQYRRAAINTLEGLRIIKKDLPDSHTALGISNCSYGLPPAARKVLNSVFLYHAVRAGLDFAIVHAGQVLPYPSIPPVERRLAEDLLFDRAPEAISLYIEYFQQKKASPTPAQHPVVALPPEEGLRQAIFRREKEGVEVLVERALELHSPQYVLNDILLPAMQEVGDSMAAGELILPFVLQSAEVMKAAVARLEQFMPTEDGASRGVILLATVAGDVHDIGKNLVKTILQNNGYKVIDLGKQVPNSTIVSRVKELKPDIVGLSALLVTTSRQMEYIVEEFHRNELEVPVIIGGAAINLSFARRISWIGSDKIYKPGVYYAQDAFSGLSFVRGLLDVDEKPKLEAMAEEGARTYYKDRERILAEAEVRKAAPKKEVEPVRHDNPVPNPPFWGARQLDHPDLDEIYNLLDTKILFKLNWGIRAQTADEYHAMVHSTFQPLLEDLKVEALKRAWILPQAVYGYFPVNADGDTVIIYDPFADDDPWKSETEIGRFSFPRQPNGNRLCVSDYFKPLESGERDIIALQVVTMGERASEVVQSFTQAGEYAKGFFLHGLAVESAEAFAEYMHRKIRAEWGIDRGQGHRYSFGYPSTPDLSQQAIIFSLLKAEEAIAARLTPMYQIVPEQSTSAFLVHHPDARYFHIEGEGLARVLREPLE